MAQSILCALLLVLFCSFSVNAYANSAPKTILVVGDSLSAEYGLAYGTGWVSLLKKKVTDQKPAIRVVNASISGDTTSSGKRRLPLLLQQHHPAIVIIELGANDGLRGLPASEMEANLRAMITAARKAGASVMLIGMQIPPNYGRHYANAFTNTFGKLAKETRSSLVPFLLEGFADNPALFQPDGLHPTAQAQSLMLDNVWPQLAPLLKKY